MARHRWRQLASNSQEPLGDFGIGLAVLVGIVVAVAVWRRLFM